MFCLRGLFVCEDVLLEITFCKRRRKFAGMFCLRGRFVCKDVLFEKTFYILGCFVCADVLYMRTFCMQGCFVGITILKGHFVWLRYIEKVCCV